MMTPLIDLHNHILPHVDDGASSLDESLRMADIAVRSGISHIVCTPHFEGSARSFRTLPDIRQAFTGLKQAIAETGLPLTLSCAAEILCTEQTLSLAADVRLPTLDGKHRLLTEFYFDESPEQINTLLSGLSAQQYVPVIAHPERYHALQRDPRLAEYWFRQGYLLQVNKGSILGAFGDRVQRTAHRLLADGAAHVIATDAHHASARTPDLSALYHWLTGHCPRNYAEILLFRNPRRILEGRPVVPV